MTDLITAFTLTAIAGLSTGIGSVLALFADKHDMKFLSVSLGFSAGVMLFVSFVEIYTKAAESLTASFGDKTGSLVTAAAFFCGIGVIAAIEKLLPKCEATVFAENDAQRKSLMRMGIFTALSIGLHNFPEGLATFVSALHDTSLAVPIAVAIAIHNIPEGIAVALPIYYATGNKKAAFRYSFLSGVSEPLGAVIGYLVLLPIMSETIFGVLFAAVAGIMVFISLGELLPTAGKYGSQCSVMNGVVIGMAIMAVSLWLL